MSGTKHFNEIPSRSFLFVTFEGGGNVPPVLGLARRLAARGHEVKVLTEPCLRGAVERSGARFLAFERHFTRVDHGVDLLGDSGASTPLAALRATLRNVVLGAARVAAEETRRAMDGAPVDVVVADAMMPGALVAAEAAGVPRVSLFHMPEYLPGPGRPPAGPGLLPRSGITGRLRDGILTRLFYRQVRPFVAGYDELRRDFGLAPLGSPEALMGQYHTADLRLIQTSSAFDFPITPAPRNVRYVGPVLDDPDWTDAWQSPWPQSDARPLVVASLSTTFQDQRALLQRIVSALGRLPVRGLVTLGPAMAEQSFDVPPNVVTVRSSSHALVFPEASAVVTHAGHGTVMRALAHDLPILCLPMGRDQDDNAARVVAHGAGLRLRPSASTRRITAAVGRLLGDDALREGASRLGGVIRADVGGDGGVAALEGLAER